MTRTVQRIVSIVAAAACCACGSGGADGQATASASVKQVGSGAVLGAADDGAASALRSSTAKAAADPIVKIPAGKLSAGSTPGDLGRDATLEPTLIEVELGEFDIDRFAYPNDPTRKPMLGASRDKAAGLCKEKGRRLCTELEWERACKGDDDMPYAGRRAWDPICSKDPSSCASSFGVLGMGSYREWTSSDVQPKGDVKGGAAVRGASAGARDVDRRCAHRSVIAGSSSDDLTFRCCGGSANEATVATPVSLGANFDKTELGVEILEQMFGTIPQLAKLKTPILYFDQEAAPKQVMSRSDAGTDDPKGYILTTQPVAWRPAPGEDLVVAAGLAGGTDSFIVALYRLPDGRHRVASTLVLKGDSGPVVLAYDRSVDNRLEWSTCWQCPGEAGRITYRDDRRVIITQE